MMIRQFLVSVLIITMTTLGVFSQTTPKRTVTINRIEIQEGNPYSMGDPTTDVISKLGLTKRNFKNYYTYWGLPNFTTSTISNLDGSVTGKITSSLVEISVTNKGQVFSFSIINRSPYWIGIDVSSINFNISYFAGDEMIPYSGADFDKTLGTLFNFERGEYDYVLLPPRAKAEWEMFRIDGIQKGYDIIHSCIKNGSRMDFTIPVFIYESDPVSSQLSKMKAKKAYQYSQYTPIQARLNYKGGYYKENETFHIHNDYIDLVRPDDGVDFKSIRLKFVCDITTSSQRIPAIKNKYGLEIYSK